MMTDPLLFTGTMLLIILIASLLVILFTYIVFDRDENIFDKKPVKITIFSFLVLCLIISPTFIISGLARTYVKDKHTVYSYNVLSFPDGRFAVNKIESGKHTYYVVYKETKNDFVLEYFNTEITVINKANDINFTVEDAYVKTVKDQWESELYYNLILPDNYIQLW